MKTTSKDRTDYAKLIRKAPSLDLSPESDREANHPILEADIPWAEVIVDAEAEADASPDSGRFDYSFVVNQPPLVSILIIGLMLIALLFLVT